MPTQITIQTKIAASIDKAWQCYTQPEHITRWNFASDDWCCPSAEVDLKVGGRYCARMEAKDGSFGFDFEATYDEVQAPNALQFTMPDGRVVRTEFKQEQGATVVTTTFDAEDENPIEMQRDGWQAILDNFGAYVENGSVFS